MVEAYWEDADCYAETVTSYLHVLKAVDDGRVVGVKVFGVKKAVDDGK